MLTRGNCRQFGMIFGLIVPLIDEVMTVVYTLKRFQPSKHLLLIIALQILLNFSCGHIRSNPRSECGVMTEVLTSVGKSRLRYLDDQVIEAVLDLVLFSNHPSL